ncbi:hypothetical protein SFRURICE_012616, partial [Spodoptera frugiperda]
CIKKRQKQAAISSGESESSSSSDDDDKTSCSEPEEQRENIEVAQSLDLSVDLIQEPVPLITGVPMVDEQDPNVSRDVLLSQTLSMRSSTPFIEESWCQTVTEIPNFNFDHSQCGITVDVDGMNSVIDFFHLVFPQNFIEYLVNCTNSYGNALCNTSKPHTRHSRKTVYRETNCEEMMKFLGLTLLQAHVRCPKQRNVFSLSNPLYYHPIFSYILSGRRYEQILRCICASELDAKGENKIVKFIDMLTVNFRKIYNAGEELSLDESLLLFRGRLHFRQYIKSKKARYGIKFFELTTSDGYVLNVKMYSGKETTEQDMGLIKIMIGIGDRNLKGVNIVNTSNIYDNRRFRPSTSTAFQPTKTFTDSSIDKRGKHQKTPAFDRNLLNQHIESFNPLEPQGVNMHLCDDIYQASKGYQT